MNKLENEDQKEKFFAELEDKMKELISISSDVMRLIRICSGKNAADQLDNSSMQIKDDKENLKKLKKEARFEKAKADPYFGLGSKTKLFIAELSEKSKKGVVYIYSTLCQHTAVKYGIVKSNGSVNNSQIGHLLENLEQKGHCTIGYAGKRKAWFKFSFEG